MDLKQHCDAVWQGNIQDDETYQALNHSMMSKLPGSAEAIELCPFHRHPFFFGQPLVFSSFTAKTHIAGARAGEEVVFLVGIEISSAEFITGNVREKKGWQDEKQP